MKFILSINQLIKNRLYLLESLKQYKVFLCDKGLK